MSLRFTDAAMERIGQLIKQYGDDHFGVALIGQGAVIEHVMLPDETRTHGHLGKQWLGTMSFNPDSRLAKFGRYDDWAVVQMFEKYAELRDGGHSGHFYLDEGEIQIVLWGWDARQKKPVIVYGDHRQDRLQRYCSDGAPRAVISQHLQDRRGGFLSEAPYSDDDHMGIILGDRLGSCFYVHSLWGIDNAIGKLAFAYLTNTASTEALDQISTSIDPANMIGFVAYLHAWEPREAVEYLNRSTTPWLRIHDNFCHLYITDTHDREWHYSAGVYRYQTDRFDPLEIVMADD